MVSFPYARLLSSLLERFPENTRWAVTCGSALALHGLEYTPSDLDFFAPYEDMQRIAQRLGGLPVEFAFDWISSEQFHSYWGRFCVQETHVDFVGDFSARREGMLIAWDAAHPCWGRLWAAPFGATNVPTFSLEDLFMLYLALPNEESKLDLIAGALRQRGCDGDYLEACGERWPVFRERLRTLL